MISVIIPALDEAESLLQLHRELDAVATEHGYDLQIIFVDDGSTDNTWQEIEQLSQHDDRVLGIRFRRNFGKAAALSAGFDAVTGEVIIMLDADLQDNPAEFPNLLAKLDEGYDVANGWKKTRYDPWHKVWPSKVFNWMVSRFSGVMLHDHNCGLKCFRRDVINEIRLYGELHRFVPVLAAARGFRVGEVVVKHRPREYGRSKYGWSRIPKGLIDLISVQFITRYGLRPQHWLGTTGLGSLLLGVLGMVYLALGWCWSRTLGEVPIHLHETAALYYSLALLMVGTQLLATSLVAEMIASLASRDSDNYSISQYTGPREQRSEQQTSPDQETHLEAKDGH